MTNSTFFKVLTISLHPYQATLQRVRLFYKFLTVIRKFIGDTVPYHRSVHRSIQ